MRKCVLVVFVKTPTLSPIKTRLAASIGKAAAEEFYTLSIAALRSSIESLVANNTNITPIWAVAEEEGLNHPLWRGWSVLAQGAGDLGDRLHTVYSHLIAKFDSVVIIGSDSPQLSASNLSLAFEVLDDRKVGAKPLLVVGPAIDGGFYLAGSSAVLPKSLWSAVRYSTKNAGQDLIDAAQSLGEVVTLPEEIDVDTVSDLDLLKEISAKRLGSTVAHSNLMDWLNLK